MVLILCFKICFCFFQVHHRPGGRHSIRFVAFWIRHRWDNHTHWIAQDCQIAQIGPRCQKNWQILRVRSGRAHSTYGHIRPYCSLVGLYLVRFSYKKYAVITKEVCNRGVACSLLKLGSLEKKRYSFSIPLCFALRHHFFVEKMISYVILEERQVMPFFDKKKTKRFYDAKLIFWSFATFFCSNHF